MDTRAIYVTLAVIALAVAGVFFMTRAKAQPAPDSWVISQLQKAGSDLSKPHLIEFFLYVPSNEAAERLAAKIRLMGFGTEVKKAAKSPDWLILATKQMVPVERELIRLRNEFESMTKAEGGGYDGWGAPVVK